MQTTSCVMPSSYQLVYTSLKARSRQKFSVAFGREATGTYVLRARLRDGSYLNAFAHRKECEAVPPPAEKECSRSTRSSKVSARGANGSGLPKHPSRASIAQVPKPASTIEAGSSETCNTGTVCRDGASKNN